MSLLDKLLGRKPAEPEDDSWMTEEQRNAKLAWWESKWADRCVHALSLVLWVLALSRTEVSVMYPMVSIGFALNALLAWWLLGEALNAQRLIGIAVIMLGVWLVARS